MSKTETTKQKVQPQQDQKEPKNFLQLPIGIENPEEYYQWLLESIAILNAKLFTQDKLDLEAEDCDALYVLNDFQKRMLRMRKKEPTGQS